VIAATLAVDAVLAVVALAALAVAGLDAVRVWRTRPPVVRGSDGVWRAVRGRR
jgi:hypothetical protein